MARAEYSKAPKPASERVAFLAHTFIIDGDDRQHGTTVYLLGVPDPDGLLSVVADVAPLLGYSSRRWQFNYATNQDLEDLIRLLSELGFRVVERHRQVLDAGS